MNNFYTVTVYDKGAEVIRMFHTLLGPDGFRRGMDEYFKRHDGQAVTCDDFISAMQSATDLDLTQFARWYSQSGTPVISVEHKIQNDDNDDVIHTFTLSQHTPATSDQSEKESLYIPVNIEIIDDEGNTYTDNESMIQNGMVILNAPSMSFTVNAENASLTPVVLGNFSAPAKVENPLDTASLLTIFKYAKDPFNRWDAMQTLYDRCIKQIEDAPGCAISNDIWEGIKQAIAQEQSNLELLGECLVIPSFETLCQSRSNINVSALSKARKAFCDQFAQALEQELLQVFNNIDAASYSYTQDAVNQRRCKNVVLAHLARLPQHEGAIVAQFDAADNMTDTLGALRSAQHCNSATFDTLMARFEATWNHDPLVLDLSLIHI